MVENQMKFRTKLEATLITLTVMKPTTSLPIPPSWFIMNLLLFVSSLACVTRHSPTTLSPFALQSLVWCGVVVPAEPDRQQLCIVWQDPGRYPASHTQSVPRPCCAPRVCWAECWSVPGILLKYSTAKPECSSRS